MGENKTCIICRKVKKASEFNIEHIIPESIGNKTLTLNCICKECNSGLGKKIDYQITNNIVSEIKRFHNKIKGKSGKVPNPFRKGKTQDGRTIYCDKNLKPKLETQVTFDKNTKKYRVSANSTDEAIKILNKKLKRIGKAPLTKEHIKKIYNERKIIKEQPIMEINTEINLYEIEMEMIKIAYEYMYLLVGNEYLEDEQGKKISKILNEYIYNNKIANLNRIIVKASKENDEVINLIKKLGKVCFKNEDVHCIQLIKNENQIVISVIIFSFFNYSVLVSNKNYNLGNQHYIINPKDGKVLKLKI